jgi:hypothetical protein
MSRGEGTRRGGEGMNTAIGTRTVKETHGLLEANAPAMKVTDMRNQDTETTAGIATETTNGTETGMMTGIGANERQHRCRKDER